MPYRRSSALYLATVSMIALAAPAGAACVQTGDEILCTGTENTAVTTDDAALLTVEALATIDIATGDAVTLEADGSVFGGTTVNVEGEINANDVDPSDGLVLDDDDTVNIGGDGFIRAGDDGIAAGDALTVVTSGGIVTGDKGVTAGHDVTVVNSGTISAAGEGINLKHRATVTNSGLILTIDRGIDVKDDALIVNSGAITSIDEGVEMDDGGVLINTGLIQSDQDDGINPGEQAVIVNHQDARIQAGDDGIDIDSGVIWNLGEIISNGAAGIDVDAADNDLTILNYGSVIGQAGILVEDGSEGPANTRSQTVLLGVEDPLPSIDPDFAAALDNAPDLFDDPEVALVGLSGIAASLADGDDFFGIEGDVSIFGDVLLGEGQDILSVTDLPSLLPVIGVLAATGPDSLLFDGGNGFDAANFVMPEDEFLSIASVSGSDVILAVTDPQRGNPFDMVLRNFEQFDLFTSSDAPTPFASFDLPSLSAALSGEVPLPAGVVLMGSALFGLGALRRR